MSSDFRPAKTVRLSYSTVFSQLVGSSYCMKLGMSEIEIKMSRFLAPYVSEIHPEFCLDISMYCQI